MRRSAARPRLAFVVVWLLALAAPAARPSHAGEVAPALSASSLLRSADLRADLDALERVYRALHPGLLRYNTPAQLDALFAAARADFARDRTLGDAFVVLTRLTAGLRCGHSYPNPSNQPRPVASALFEGPRLPFWFRWIDDQLVITRNLSHEPLLAPGTTVEELGGTPTAAILAGLLPLARADGHNDGKRRAYLAVTGESTHEAFDILAPLVFARQLAGPDVTLTLRSAAGARARVTVPLQSFAERRALVEAAGAEPAADAPLWQVERLTRGGQALAYLKMPSWVAYKSKWDWKANLQSLSTELARTHTRALIVDLRGNEGGNDVGDEILAHLIDRPLRRAAMVRRVRFGSVPAPLRPLLDTWDASFFELGREATPLADGWRELAPEVGSDVIAPRAPRFDGRLIVLTDASNSSATFQFALTVQRGKLGTLVGSTTGGSQRGINGGAFFFVRLPRTRLEVDLPLIGTFPDGAAPDAGVTPDVTVEVTREDVASGRDRAREAALDLALRPR